MSDTIYNWLKTFPGLELLQREQVEEVPGGCGLHFCGVTVKDRSRDLLGNLRCRKQLRFRLRRFGERVESGVFFLLLGAWVEENTPILGICQTACLKDARCIRDEDLGLSLWEADLEITYTEDSL